MKIYVWEEVLHDYTAGLVVVLAPDLETARKMACEATGSVYREPGDREDLIWLNEFIRKDPEIFDPLTSDPQTWFVHGGG